MILFAGIVLILAAGPAIMTLVNLMALRLPEPAPDGMRVAILIPARDEEAGHRRLRRRRSGVDPASR